MKKVICILLAISLMLSIATPVFAEESDEPRYGTLKVEYSDALGSVERLSVMVKDDHVYADAVALSDRLGYNCIQDGDLVSIYTENNFFYPNAPLLAVHFYVNKSKVAYNPLFGAEYEYTAPAPCIVDENGVWVPLTYTLVLLGGNSTMLDDTLLIQMPQNNVLSIAATIVNNEDTLSFDWVSHFGYSEITTNVTDGAGRIVTLFSGLLEFDGDAWLSLIDWSAFDKKFGKSLATMFCTNSAEELQESIAQVELLLDVFSPEGKAGEMLRNKQIRIDSDVTAWKNACDEYLKLLEQGSGSPTKYNMLYQQYERAVDDQSLFAALGGDDAIYIQNELSSAANVLDIASKVGSAVSYFKEFQQKDAYQISVLKNYLSTRTATDDMPDATADAMMKYLASTDSAGQYVFSRFLEENALELIVDKSGLDAYLGLPANILLFAWDIMSGTIPFYSEGLKAVENREISNYAQKMQNDVLANLKYLIAELKKSSTISAEDCVQLSEYCYVYLKACYIARSSAIKSLDNTSEEFREQIKGKLDVESDINQFTIQYLSVLSSADIENSCYILGFLPENNEQYLNDYSDDVLLDKIDYILTGTYSSEERYQAYAELIENYESQYGIAKVHKMDEWFSYMTGLCFMKLVDFTQSGQEDLLLVYQTNVDNAWGVSREYTFEVWGFQGNKMVMLDSGELFGTDGGVKTVYLTEYNENIYLVTGGTDSFGYYYYHGYSNGEFGIVREAEWDWDEEYICSIDGIDVTYEEFETEQEKWLGNSIEYNLNYDCNAVLLLNEETKKALSPFYEGTDESTNDTEISVRDDTFEYQDGELLSSFSALMGDGNYVGLAFWHNYGDSASDEDFIFEWEDGKWEYTVVGGRSGREFLIVFTPAESGMNIQVTCLDGTYYSWKTGEKSEEWINELYIKQ